MISDHNFLMPSGGRESVSSKLFASSVLLNGANKNGDGDLYVGDLSYFCDENHLTQLFGQFGSVVSCRVMRNYNHSKSLLFGFVTMSTAKEAIAAMQALHSQMYMGRKLKVQFASARQHGSANKQPEPPVGTQVHVSFSSNFQGGYIVKPTEVFLTNFFSAFGPIADVIVRAYTMSTTPQYHWQEGYGFVTFMDEESALRAIKQCNPSANCQGITMTVKVSYRTPLRTPNIKQTEDLPQFLSTGHNTPMMTPPYCNSFPAPNNVRDQFPSIEYFSRSPPSLPPMNIPPQYSAPYQASRPDLSVQYQSDNFYNAPMPSIPSPTSTNMTFSPFGSYDSYMPWNHDAPHCSLPPPLLPTMSDFSSMIVLPYDNRSPVTRTFQEDLLMHHEP